MIFNRVIPASESRFPDKSLILLIDQAPYHTTRTGFPDVSKASKLTVFNWLIGAGCVTLDILRICSRRRGGKVVTEEKNVHFDLIHLSELDKLPQAPKGPSKDELLYGAYLWAMRYRPDDLRIDIEVEMKEKGHFVIFNVPNCPQYNPSELVNGHSKRNMREDFETGRGTQGLHRDLVVGMNGGMRKKQKRVHRGIDADMSRNWWRHCLETLRGDCRYLGLEGDVIDWWTPDCGVSIFDTKIHCPFSPKRKKEMNDKFTIDTSTWPNDNRNGRHHNRNRIDVHL